VDTVGRTHRKCQFGPVSGSVGRRPPQRLPRSRFRMHNSTSVRLVYTNAEWSTRATATVLDATGQS